MARLQPLHRVKSCPSFDVMRRAGHNTKVSVVRGEHGLLGSFVVRYHRTNVLTWDAINQRLYIKTGGWRSVTTSQRLHFYLRELGLWLSTNDLPGRWRVMDNVGNAFTIRGDNLTLHLSNRDASCPWERVA